jgi:hypothetical protein
MYSPQENLETHQRHITIKWSEVKDKRKNFEGSRETKVTYYTWRNFHKIMGRFCLAPILQDRGEGPY